MLPESFHKYLTFGNFVLILQRCTKKVSPLVNSTKLLKVDVANTFRVLKLEKTIKIFGKIYLKD